MNSLKIGHKILTLFYREIDSNLKLILKQKLAGLTVQDSLDNARITRIVYGTIRWDIQISHILSILSRIKISKIEPDTLVLLKMGLFLLRFSDSMPDYAVLNEIVSLAPKRSRGFINGILRSYLRQQQDISRGIQNGPLAIRHAMSETLINSARPLMDDPEPLLSYLNREPVFHLKRSPQKRTGIKPVQLDPPLPYLEGLDCFEMVKSGPLIQQAINRGEFYIQNSGSQLIAIIAAHYATGRVLDCCAAPGLKSVSITARNPGLEVVANDIHHGRMKMLDHQRYPEIIRTVSDMNSPPFRDRFDLILLDAPCSSSGTIRKSPDLKLKMDPARIAKNSQIQSSILRQLIRNHPSASILYTVCSFIPEEGEKILDPIIGASESTRIDSVDLGPLLSEYRFRFKRGKHGFFLLPDPVLNNDLFYMALLSRESSSSLLTI